MSDEVFFDTNVLLYLLMGDERKANRTEALLAKGGVISVQVLNEFTSVSVKKYRIDLRIVRELLTTLRANTTVVPLTIEVHDRGLRLVERHRMPVYDAMIAAAALEAGCTTLYSEDMQDGFLIEGLRISNPFK